MMFFVRLLRIKHWVKNAFIFFPLLFSGKFNESHLVIKNIYVFVGFCLISSGLYILNDFLDIEKDRLHPKKSQRPLAQAHISVGVVVSLICVLILGGFWLCYRGEPMSVLVASTYLLLNAVYNIYTKRVVILDVLSIAFGFHLRVWAGAMASQIIPSIWLQLCVFLLALFLGFTKRRHEMSTLKSRASEHRSVLSHYTAYLLDQLIIICSTLAIIFYGLYTISPEITQRLGSRNITYSLVFVMYGMFRYLYLVHVRKVGDDPADILLSDIPLIVCIVLWIVYISGFIYFN